MKPSDYCGLMTRLLGRQYPDVAIVAIARPLHKQPFALINIGSHDKLPSCESRRAMVGRTTVCGAAVARHEGNARITESLPSCRLVVN